MTKHKILGPWYTSKKICKFLLFNDTTLTYLIIVCTLFQVLQDYIWVYRASHLSTWQTLRHLMHPLGMTRHCCRWQRVVAPWATRQISSGSTSCDRSNRCSTEHRAVAAVPRSTRRRETASRFLSSPRPWRSTKHLCKICDFVHTDDCHFLISLWRRPVARN